MILLFLSEFVDRFQFIQHSALRQLAVVLAAYRLQKALAVREMAQRKRQILWE